MTDTNFLSGYTLNLAGSTGVFATQTAPTTPLHAQDGGSFQNVLISGNVTNSIFAASTEPFVDGTFGTAADLFLPHGLIRGKVEGTIDNSLVTPDAPDQAFYAHSVTLGTSGPGRAAGASPKVSFPGYNAGVPPSGHRIVNGLQHFHSLTRSTAKTRRRRTARAARKTSASSSKTK